MVQIHSGLSTLAEDYQGFIVDLWGVMHDGVDAFPAAVACLEELRRRGKGIAILSNAPRRAEVVAARTADLGISPGLWDAVLSSGEETWRHLARRPDDWYQALGRRCHHLGPERDIGMRAGLDYDFVEAPGSADFLLVTGALSPEDRPESYRRLLDQALDRDLPMVCANPDLEVIRGGQREICAGAIAMHYREMGGRVREHGKPDPAVYRSCIALLGLGGGGRIAGIGDSLRTDIAGARQAGLDGIFITGGVQGEELGVDAAGNADPARLARLCAAAGEDPIAALPVLRW